MKFVVMELSLVDMVALVAVMGPRYMIPILTCVAMVKWYQEGVVHLVVVLFLITGILTHAMVGKLVYEVAIQIAVMIQFMIFTLTYVVVVL